MVQRARAIQCSLLHSTGWTPAWPRLYDSRVPDLTLSHEELRDAAMAAGLAAIQAERDAEAQQNPASTMVPGA